MRAHPSSANTRNGDSDSQAFLLGLKMKRDKLIFGVGINDADYSVNTRKGSTITFSCKYYQAWINMLQRCYSPSRHARNPSYVGCRVTPEWLRFSNFKEWMSSKEWEGNHLDKDILSPGNKLYSPETCVFISGNLNKFLCDAGAIRGQWPIGVCWAKREGKFLARCCNPADGKYVFLGYFDCPNRAHEAWRKAKHNHALAYADKQSDQRIAQALRIRYLPKLENPN